MGSVQGEIRESRTAQRCAVGAACWCVLVGGVTLLGYGLGLRDLARVLPVGPVMQPTTAVCLILLGIAAGLLAPRHPSAARRRAGQVLALSAASIGAVLIAEYATSRSTGIELLLFPGQFKAWTVLGGAGRSPIYFTASGSVLFGLALALLDAQPRRLGRPARLLVPAAGLIPVVTLISYSYGLTYLRAVNTVTGMALNSALTFAVLWVSILGCRPELPPARMFYGPGLGAVMLRRLAPVVSVTVLLVGTLLSGLRGSTPSSTEGLLVTIGILSLLGTLYLAFLRVGTVLDEAGNLHEHLITELRDERDVGQSVLQSLHDGVMTLDANGTVLQVNRRWCEITGFPAADIVGTAAPYPWWPPEELSDRVTRLAAALETGAASNVQVSFCRPDGVTVKTAATVTAVRHADGRVRTLVTSYRDLTAEIQAAAQQQRLATELEHFFTKSADLLCILDTDGRFLRINPAWERTFGFTADDVLNRRHSDFAHPDDVVRSATTAADVFAHGTPVTSLNSRYRCRDGSYRWLNWNATADLETGQIFASARDVTANREADQAKALLAAIIDSTTDAIIGSDLDGTIISWNPAATRTYGYAAENAIGRPMDFLLPADRAEETTNLRQVTSGQPVTNHDTIRLRRDGASVHVALTVSPIRDSTGTVIGAAHTSRDLTQQDKAEDRFRRLVEFAPVALVIVDRGGVIVLANDQTNHMFGYPADALVGHPIELLIPQRLHDVHRPYRSEYIAAPQPRLMGAGRELVALRNDGSEFPVEISLAPLDTDQGTLVSAAILDLTVRRQVERASADARDEALAAAQIKTQFVAMVSHEIRTPMNGVIGLTRLLLHTPLTPAQRRYAEAIRTSGQALLVIINDILDFSKIEAGKIALVDADFDLHVLLEDVVQVAAETGRAKDLEVLADYPPTLVRAVRGDAGRLRQVLLNLLGNAVKFTEHGEVLLRTVSAADTADGRPQVTFAVTDTGIGISPADQINLFEPFSQVDAAANRQFGGTGIGLTICHQLIGLMGGRLDVESALGHGSAFTFTIALTPRPDPPEGAARLQLLLAGQRILIVDDNPTSQHLITEHVKAWGMTATAVEDGQNALDTLRDAGTRHQPYDIALIDQNLPGMGGTELTDLIADDPDLATTRVILLTSGSYHDDEIAEAAGALAMLAKPVGPSTLYNCLIEILIGDDSTEDTTIRDRQIHPEADHGIVLIAEDNAINELVAVETLAELGYRADIAHNGLEALQLADTKPYLAILMDCQMPEMDGYTATAELRRREDSNHHIPIIAMTAGAFAEDRQRCLQAGMDDYLAKPIDPDELRTALDRWTNAPATTERDRS